MTITELMSKPEFWSALFGALAAFLLGSLATWWAGVRAKRTAGNLTLVALSQMYAQLENIRQSFLIDEPNRVREELGHDPFTFQLRGLIGLPHDMPKVVPDSIGFLVESHDPDIFARLLGVEREFVSIIALVRRHEERHGRFQAALNAVDPTGRRPTTIREFVAAIGAQPFIELDNIVVVLQKSLPETCADLLSVADQLRRTLRFQFPVGTFIKVIPTPRRQLAELPANVEKPALLRRILRWLVDLLTSSRHWRKRTPAPQAESSSKYPRIQRFPRD